MSKINAVEFDDVQLSFDYIDREDGKTFVKADILIDADLSDEDLNTMFLGVADAFQQVANKANEPKFFQSLMNDLHDAMMVDIAMSKRRASKDCE